MDSDVAATAALNFPAPHFMQTVCPLPALYLPAVHSLHVSPLLNLPSSQSLHSVELMKSTSLYLPPPQAVQPVAPGSA